MKTASGSGQARHQRTADIRNTLYREFNFGTVPFTGQAACEVHSVERLKGTQDGNSECRTRKAAEEAEPEQFRWKWVELPPDRAIRITYCLDGEAVELKA